MISLFVSRLHCDVFLGLDGNEHSFRAFDAWVRKHYISAFANRYRRIVDYYYSKTGFNDVEPHVAREYFKGLLSERARELEDNWRSYLDDDEAHGNLVRSIKVMREYIDKCDNFEEQWNRPSMERFVINADEAFNPKAQAVLLIAHISEYAENIEQLEEFIESYDYCFETGNGLNDMADSLEVKRVYSVHNSVSLALWFLYERLVERYPIVTKALSEVRDFSAFRKSVRELGIVLEKFEGNVLEPSDDPSKPNE